MEAKVEDRRAVPRPPHRCAHHHHHHHILPPPPAYLCHHHSYHMHHHAFPPPPFQCSYCKQWNFPASHNVKPHFLPCLESNSISQQQEEIYNLLVPDSYKEENVHDRCDIEDEDGDFELVMTDEWMEFFAKSEARRQEKKRQQKKVARDLRKAAKAKSQLLEEQ